MCPPPCGPRRSSRRSSTPRVSLPPIKTYISKKAVADIINSGNFECTYKSILTKSEFVPYDCCMQNMFRILQDSETTVKVAGRRSQYFQEGIKTIIMEVPEFATLLIKVTE